VLEKCKFFCWLDSPFIFHNVRFSECSALSSQFIKKNPTRCNNVSKFYYSIFIWSSTCFGWHTTHLQEPKTALAASGFSYMGGCSFRLLMMGGVLPETCWASYKYVIIKFWYIVASCWIFLYELYYDAWIHEHQTVFTLGLFWSSSSSAAAAATLQHLVGFDFP